MKDLKNDKSEKKKLFFGKTNQEKIILISNILKNFIDEIGVRKTDFYEELDTISKSPLNNISIKEYEKYRKYYEKFGINILNDNEKNNDYLNILYCINDKKDSIKFIMELKRKDIIQLKEIMEEEVYIFYLNDEMQDMLKCYEFIHNLIDNKEKNDTTLIKNYIIEVQKSKNIYTYFLNYINSFNQIEESYSLIFDRFYTENELIKNIMKWTEFNLILNNSNELCLKFKGMTKDESFFTKILDYNDIIRLNEHALLLKQLKKVNKQEDEQIFDVLKSISNLVNKIEKIYQILEKIGQKGYTKEIKIIIQKNENRPSYSINNIQFDNFEIFFGYLDEVLNEIIEIQNDYYMNEELIRYIYGKQFNLFFTCLTKERNYKNLIPFLKFLTNDKIDSFQILNDFNYDYDLNENHNICLLENIKKFLTDFLKDNNLQLETIYKQNMIKEKYREQFVGIFIYSLIKDDSVEPEKGIEVQILNWYNYLTGNPPMAQTILLCNGETTFEEITSFIYRAFLCQYPAFFVIGKIECLSSEKKEALIKLINLLYNDDRLNEMNSCVVFAYSDKNDNLLNYLKNIRGCKYLSHDDKKNEGLILYDENVEIIISDKPGIGKSTQIKLKVLNDDKMYIYFPFGGELNKKDILNQLKKLQEQIKEEENTVIHLDLYDSKHTELMKDFLYRFLITKFYGQNEDLFYLPKKVNIMIEIPHGFNNIIDKFSLLSMFKYRTKINFSYLKIELNSNIQIVCNYLKLLKSGQISNKDLIIKGISLSEYDIKNIINNDIIKEDTTIDAKLLEQNECQNLIKDLFKNKLKIENPTYYQIISFINILAGQLKKFSMNFLFTAANLIQTGNLIKDNTFNDLRELVINNFIKNTIHFALGNSDKIFMRQHKASFTKIEDKELIQQIESDDIISFNKISSGLVFFNNGDGQDFTIISLNDGNNNEYNKLLKFKKSLIIAQNKEYECYGLNYLKVPIPTELKNYRNFNHHMFFEEIKEVLSLKNPRDNWLKNHYSIDLKSIEEIAGNYIFTADNFIKMILILLRERENVPVILMGETGCGKTSLILKISELMNNGENKIMTLNVHPAMTTQNIVDFMEKVIKERFKLEEKEKIIQEEYEKKGIKYTKKKLWVFFDEINSCNCLNIITEIMTKRSFQAKQIPNDIFFIGACHPLRYGTKKELNYSLKNKKLKEKKLIYNVNPLPISLINFVVNFGSISPEDEKLYIKNMISLKYYKLREELKTLSIKSIIEAQNFVRNINGISSASLYNIKYFWIFLDFFVKYFIKIKKLPENVNNKDNFELENFMSFYSQLKYNEIYQNSIKLSLYICYYLSLPSIQLREDFSNRINSIFGDEFLEIAKHEQQYIAKNIKIKNGIVKNRIFLENIFALFSCINAKVPLFIIGESGSSKNLACQVLANSMRGDSSDNVLFKSFPKLFIQSYQGSINSTYEGIFNFFRRSKDILKRYPDKKIPMFLFNDMGLTELSSDNTLNYLHSLLDNNLKEEKNKISFVGLSNWVIDRATMNRGINLIITPLEKQQLEMTALAIAESYDKLLAQNNKNLFIILANAYFEYKKILKEQYSIKEDFHGLRDFYYLIKTAIRLIIEKKKNDLNFDIDDNFRQKVGIISIERNFAGFEFFNNNKISSKTSLEIFKTIFRKSFPKCDMDEEYNILKRIEENIKDNNSRYLLLITKTPILKYIIISIFNSPKFNKNLNKDLSSYVGSCFEEDIKSERYENTIFNIIEFQIEKNKLLILSDLKKIYLYLIQLFKQNFVAMTKINLKNKNDINFNSINDEFKCIFLLDEKEIDEVGVSSLNMFEKHLISFDNLLEKKFLEKGEYINKIIEDFIDINLFEKLNIDKKLNISAINWNKEEIQEIIYIKTLENKKEGKQLFVEDLNDIIFEKYSNTLSQDIIFLLKNSYFEKKYPEIAEKIINFYKKGEHGNIYNFLKKMKFRKNLIYTFTNIEEPLLQNIANDFEFEIELFGKIRKSNIKEIKISSINNENELEENLNKIYIDENNYKIIAFKFNDENRKFVNHIMYFINHYIKEKNISIHVENQKALIFLVHMKKTINNEFKNQISNVFNFEQIFIDNLNGEDFSFIDIINLKGEEENEIKDGNFLNLEIKEDSLNNFLINNYKEIINKEISIIDFLIYNFETLSVECILILLEKSNTLKIFELLLNKLEKFLIKEEELFNQEKKTKSFQLLEGIIEHKLLDKFNLLELKDINYIKYSLQNKENIKKKIKKGEIYYNSLKNIDSNHEQMKIFEEKLNILLFKNKNDIEVCMKILKDKLLYITENLLILQKILFKFKNVDKYNNDITKIQNLIDSIKLGKINEIDKQELKNEIDLINNDFNKIDLEKMNKYKQSKFFMLIYETKRLNNNIPLKEHEYFEQAEKDLSKFKLLFQSQKWYEEIPEQLIMDCFKCINDNKKNNLRNELNALIDIFDIKEFDDLKMNSLLFGVLSFCKKKEILIIAKNLYNIINELEAIQTDIFKKFTKIRSSLLIKFDYNEILNLVKIFEYLGFNLLNPDENDMVYINLLLNNFSEDSFKFLANIDDNDIKTLEELINNNEDKSINNEDIKEMIKCSNFIHSLGQIKGNKNDQDLIKEFINEVQRTKTISESFKNYAKCSEKILKLLNKK